MTTDYTITDDPKMLRETLCVAQGAIGILPDDGRNGEHIDRIGRLITECDRHRPLGPNGKHGDRHTTTCGCEDDQLPDTTTPTREDFYLSVRAARIAADDVAIGFQGTPAARTSAIVKRALGALLAQGMIELTPRATWPEWQDIDQRHPFEGEAGR